MSILGFLIIGDLPSFYVDSILGIGVSVHTISEGEISNYPGRWVILTTRPLPPFTDKIVFLYSDVPQPTLVAGSQGTEEILLSTLSPPSSKILHRYQSFSLSGEAVSRIEYLASLLTKKFAIFEINSLDHLPLYECLVLNVPLLIWTSSIPVGQLAEIWKRDSSWGFFVKSEKEIETAIPKLASCTPRNFLLSLLQSSIDIPLVPPTNRDVVLIVNCLNPPSTPLSYTSVRTVFSLEERWSQLVNSIRSIQRYLPDADILVGEVGNISSTHLARQTLIPGVKWLNYGKDPVISRQRDSPYKGLTEILVLQKSFEEWRGYRRLFKLSGRYEITRVPPPESGRYLFSLLRGKRVVSTVYYGVPNSLFSHFLDILNRHLVEYDNLSIEDSMVRHIPDKLIDWHHRITRPLGSRGFISVTGKEMTA